MALTPTAAKAAARAQIDASFGPIDSALQPAEVSALNVARDELAAAIASMSAYIKANAQVISTVAVASVAAVQPGSGVSGPGTGTATGTVT